MLVLMVVLFSSVEACDDTRDCARLVRFCNVHVAWLKRMCPKSCGYCTGAEIVERKELIAGEVKKDPQGVTIVRPVKARKDPSTKQALFETEILTRHNEKRKLHNSTPLTWSKVLAERAKSWCWNLLKTQRFEHRPDNDKYGENLYMRRGTIRGKLGAVATDAWYDEIKSYRWGLSEEERWDNVAGNVTGHFTTLVWKSSKEVGCGWAARKREVYVCCNYGPKGNQYGKYDENVLPISYASNKKEENVTTESERNGKATNVGDGKAKEENVKHVEKCGDISRYCARYSKYCSTSQYKRWLYKYCKMSCGHCEVVTDSGADNSGADNSGADNSGADNSGADNSGADNSGADNSGADNSGADNSGADNSGADGNRADGNSAENRANKVHAVHSGAREKAAVKTEKTSSSEKAEAAPAESKDTAAGVETTAVKAEQTAVKEEVKETVVKATVKETVVKATVKETVVKAPTPDVKTSANCADISQHCAGYINYCTNREYTRWLGINCKQTCNLCKERADENAESFPESILSAHNELRALHGVGALTWSDELEQHAKTHCDQLSQGAHFRSSTGHSYGENLYKGVVRSGVLGRYVVKRWYDRGVETYDWSRGGYQKDTGQMTQIIWRGTTSVGCSDSKQGEVSFVCCNYDPKGNDFGHDDGENILPLKQ